MNRKLKALGLALVAVLAMGAFSASAASAGDFHSESATDTVIKGSQEGTDVFTVNAGTVKCNEATYAGVQAGATATQVKVNPSYSECTAFGFVSTTIHSKQCTYEFSGDNNNVVIDCPTNEPITVTAFNCWVTVDDQTIGGISYTNKGAGTSRDVHVHVTSSGIKYTQHSKSFPGCSSGTFTNGTYTGTATVQGFTTGGTQVGVWRE
jgi:hypothetical protein